jgi:membrane protease subunit HflK
MVESRQGSNLLYLPLDKIMQQSAGSAAAGEPALLPGGVATPPALPSAPATSAADTRARDASRTRDRDTR